MSEAASDILASAENKQQKAADLAEFITDKFTDIAVCLEHGVYRDLGLGETRDLLIIPGEVKLSLRYERRQAEPQTKRYLASLAAKRLEISPPTYHYTMHVTEAPIGPQPPDFEPLGWYMPLHLVAGPKLKVDTPATAEELVGSTSEERLALEKLIERVHESVVPAGFDYGKEAPA